MLDQIITYWTQPIDTPTQVIVTIAVGIIAAVVMLAAMWYRGYGQSKVYQKPDGTFGVDQIREARIAQLQAQQDSPTARLARLHAEKVAYDAPTVGRFGQKGGRS